MKRGLLVLLIFLIFISSAYALTLGSQTCKNNGEFTITLEAENKSLTYTDQIEIFIDGKKMEGTWDINYMKRDPPDRGRQFATFISKEGQVLGGGKKIMTINYPLGENEYIKNTYELQEILDCPDYIFSCALLNVEVNECFTTEDNVFYSYFTLNGFKQSLVGELSTENNLNFILNTENPYEDITNRISTNGVIPKRAIVRQYEGDKYMIKYEFTGENSVERFRVGLTGINQCLVTKYEDYNLVLDDISECTKKSSNGEIIPPIEKEENVDEEISNEVIEEEIPQIEEKPELVEEKKNNDLAVAIIVVLIVGGGLYILFKIIKPKF